MHTSINHLFHAAKQNRIFQDVVDQIQEAILDGSLKVGDMLPAERELKEMFKTSRGTLREALRVLEQKGLIEIKVGVGGGAKIKSVNVKQIGEGLDILIRSQRVSLRDLAEFREGVEGIVAGLAVERAKEEDILHLKKLLADAKTYLDEGASGWDEFIVVDNQLHMALAHIAGNPIYKWVLRTIYDNIHRYFDPYLPREEKLLKENYQDLCEIVEAVEQRQASRAHLLVQNHVYRFNRIMEENAQKAEGA